MSDSTQASNSEEHLVFVYGTLKRGQPNNPHLMDPSTGHAELVSRGHTREKYPLVIAGSYNIPYLLDQPGDGHQVNGEVYKVDTKKQDFLDEFETHPTYYERTQDDIVLTNENSEETETLRCWVYFMKKFKSGMLELTRWPSYDSFGSHGLPYVESEETEDLSDV